MLPTIEIYSLEISTYAVLQGIAFIAAGMLSFHRLLTAGISVHHATWGAFLAILSGLAGGYLLGSLNVLLIEGVFSRGGSTFIGGLIGGFGTAWLYCRRYGIALVRALDRIFLPLALGQAIGRVGCFSAGCCYGRVTDSWLGMYLPDIRGDWQVRYPTQLMSIGIDLLIVLTLWTVERYGARQPRRSADGTWPFAGFPSMLYVQMYVTKRFALGFLRADAEPIMGPFTLTHVLSLGGLLLATSVIVRGLVWKAKARTVPSSAATTR